MTNSIKQLYIDLCNEETKELSEEIKVLDNQIHKLCVLLNSMLKGKTLKEASNIREFNTYNKLDNLYMEKKKESTFKKKELYSIAKKYSDKYEDELNLIKIKSNKYKREYKLLKKRRNI